MPKAWTNTQISFYRKDLLDLYVRQNLTIKEIGVLLGLKESTIFNRLLRLGIKTNRKDKERDCNRKRIKYPILHNTNLSELVGALLGDGHISPGQIWLTLGSKERAYADYLNTLFTKIFEFLTQRREMDPRRPIFSIGIRSK